MDEDDTDQPLHVTLIDIDARPCDLAAVASEAGLTLQPAPASRRCTTYLDTFDGRLFKSGSVLSVVRGDAGVTLACHSLRGELLHHLHLPELPGFCRDMPDSALRNAIAAAAGVRRLLPLLEWHEEVSAWRVLDDLDKTVAHAEQISGHVVRLWNGDGQAPAPDIVTLQALRGYDAETQALVDTLRARAPGYQERADAFAELMNAAGLSPQGESNRARAQLEGTERTDHALAHVLDALRQVMVRNEAGVVADLDPEFLHDFRVAVRRTRSMLSRLKRAFPRQPLEHFRQEFAWLGALTGPTRDLDVYLSKMPEFRAGLPAGERDALDELESFLVDEQRRQHAALVAGLQSQRYADLMSAWAAFLTDLPDAADAALARLPVLDVAREVVWKQYRRVRRHGRSIDDDTPAEAVHRLRIDCKKLRYLLEAFYTLFDEAGMNRLVGALKRLQDNLGDFNDYEVQARSLRRFAVRMADDDRAPVATLLVMGRLMERMNQRQAAERDLFARRWRRFDTDPHHRFARDSFRPHDEGDD